MAYVSGEYTSASQYRVMAGSLTVGRRYILFVQDLNSDNQGSGYWYCHAIYTATSSDNQIDYRYRSVSYTGARLVRLYYGSANYTVGSLYATSALQGTLETRGTIAAYEPEYETGYVLVENEEGVKGYAYTYVLSGDDYSGSTELSPRTLYGDVDTNIKITSFSYTDSNKYTSPVKFTEYTDSSRTTVKKYWYWPTDPKIYVNTGYRYIGFKATLKTYTLTYEPNGTGVSGMPSDQTVSYGTYITVSNTTPTRSGYKFLGWSEDASAEVPDVYGGAGYVVYADRTLYAIWEKNAIEKFYWDGADGTNDATLIAKGQPVSNITAERWNALLAKIKELADAVGASFSYTTVSKGDGITAARFNAAVGGLASIKTQMGATIRLPDEQSSGNTMYAHLFNSSVSLKYALNDMIEIYNSEYR